MKSLVQLPAHAMARLVRAKEISPVELIQAHLQQIEKWNSRLNAFVSMDETVVRKAKDAETAVMQSEGTLGPLHGIPVSIKSSIDVVGLKCETGTRLRKDYVASQDAPLVARLKNAGAIVLGTTNVPEFLMAYETDNGLYGRTNSIWDVTRTAGGSSGGEAAAISAFCSSAGIGSDGGGSIRVPAHFSGICGLKPTPGRIPGTGHFPACAGPFALLGVVGPMARTIADLQLLFKVIAGPDNGDPCSAPVPVQNLTEAEVRKTRIGFFEHDGRTPVTAETRQAVRTAAESLREEGFDVTEFRPDGLERARQLWWVLFVRGGAHVLRQAYKDRESEMSSILEEFLQFSANDLPLSADDLFKTLFERDELRTRFLDQMNRFPILICPVSANPAFRHREREWLIEGQKVKYLDAVSYTQWFNLLGNPAAVVPVGRSPEGLPIGVQVVGRPYEEELVLEIAAVIERTCGGWRPPTLLTE